MEGLIKERRAIQGLAARGIGRDILQPRLLVGQIRADGLEAEIMLLPVDTSLAPGAQAPDGTFRFMVDLSPTDGPDPIG